MAGQMPQPVYFADPSTGEQMAQPVNIVDSEGTSLRLQTTLDQSAVQEPLTGSTSETTLATVTLPADAMGPNGSIRVTLLFSNNNSANNKTFRLKFGATTYYQVSVTTTIMTQAMVMISNRNDAGSQIGAQANFNGFGSAGAAVQTSSIDTTEEVTLTITGQLANAADNLALERYVVEVLA